MIFRRRHLKFISSCVCVLFLFFVINTASRHKWMILDCAHLNECTRVLFASDPQIIGERNELLHFLTPLTIWHSDRYLEKSYRQVYNFVKPDVVVFLGYLMHEGSVASEDEFIRYRRRFLRIFPNSSPAKHLWIPGDNDIGGEDKEPISNAALTHFYTTFGHTSITRFKNLVFISSKEAENVPAVEENGDVHIGLSHFPLRRYYTDTSVGIFFTGHDHLARAAIRSNLGTKIWRIDRDILKFPLINRKLQYEIRVPTCSYRMGSREIGFGYALFDKNHLRFQVLWTHDRCPQFLAWFCFIFYGLF